MKKRTYSYSKLLTGILFLLFSATVFGQDSNEPEDDKSLAPWLQVVGDTTLVPLLSTSADVQIAGVIADVRVSQVFHNTGKKPIEAIYIFPGSTRAAVYAMQMTIGKRTVVATIEEKKKARKDYENAKKQGKSASLLEQQRPNVFQMNVANILPGDTIRIEMSYTELLVPENGIYQLVYPTVVGPRYSNKKASGASPNDKWVANPYTSEGKKPTYTIDIAASITADMPIQDIHCASHKTNIQFDGVSSANIKLDPSEKYGGNRDFILDYRLTGNTVQSGILLYKGKKENYFLSMIQPPKTVNTEEIPPREYIFIVDVSGSMDGFPLNISKEILRKLIGDLRPTDMFNVLLFAGGSTLMNGESIEATKENIAKAINIIDHEQGGGGTELLPALKQALSLKPLDNYATTYVILTDGYVDVEKEAFELIRNNLSTANFFAFGIGSTVNRLLIEGIAHAGQGESFIATRPEEAEVQANKFREYIQNPLLTNIKISYNGFEAYDVTPLQQPDLFAQRPVLIYGKWKGQPQGTITVSGITGKGNWKADLQVDKNKCSNKNSAIRYLWARKKIEQLADYNKVEYSSDLEASITNLGLEYSLLTDYTSFIAIDSERRTNNTATTVVQPLPLPQGVSNQAVKYTAPVVVDEVSEEIEITVNEPVPERVEIVVLEEESIVEEEEQVFIIVEEPATFQGGDLNAFRDWVNKHVVFPPELAESTIVGKVYVQFSIDTKGQVCDVKVLREVDPLLDAEAIRVIKSSPLWTPAKQGGRSVKQQFVIPISFMLL
jgi:Ca-activated chloride channel family protein